MSSVMGGLISGTCKQARMHTHLYKISFPLNEKRRIRHVELWYVCCHGAILKDDNVRGISKIPQ